MEMIYIVGLSSEDPDIEDIAFFMQFFGENVEPLLDGFMFTVSVDQLEEILQ